ncbi:hypothetical protein JYU34_007844 [Plutella xylostella]|uniref:Uncharacterized protein n=1 Tax=Plutella xylostella TaxID=51655 RepID=A0ABQ7QRC4_PLUXY|nr:hypothetical protein JYU34_007844 [Plutella xylostella]
MVRCRVRCGAAPLASVAMETGSNDVSIPRGGARGPWGPGGWGWRRCARRPRGTDPAHAK